MPIYEYKCRCCGHQFEILHRSNLEEEPTCPDCGTAKVERLFSVFGFSSGGTFVSSTSSVTNCSSCSTKNCSSCR